MTPRSNPVHFSVAQVSNFMDHGFLRVKNCFTRQDAENWTKDVWTRLGFDPNDKSTWTRERIHMSETKNVKISDFAPKAWNAICEVLGGEDRVSKWSQYWNDAFIVNLGTEEAAWKETNPRDLDGWHVDGDFFVHFLDSPEQGLLVIPLFTDIFPDGGGTWICDDGVGEIARWLHKHPQGVLPDMMPVEQDPNQQYRNLYSEIVKSSADSSFHEMTGEVGDVILLHPLTVHSASKNERRLPRIITNPPICLGMPLNFNRENQDEYSLVELKTLKELGRRSLPEWRIRGQRKEVVSERLQM